MFGTFPSHDRITAVFVALGHPWSKRQMKLSSVEIDLLFARLSSMTEADERGHHQYKVVPQFVNAKLVQISP